MQGLWVSSIMTHGYSKYRKITVVIKVEISDLPEQDLPEGINSIIRL